MRASWSDESIQFSSCLLTHVSCRFAFHLPRRSSRESSAHRISLFGGAAPRPIESRRRLEAFQARLCASSGTWRGKTFVIEYRYAEGNRIGCLACGRAGASESGRHRHCCPAVTRAAKEATNTIPIVMAQDSDPVGNGFVASLARPGGNITGLSTLAPEISGKRLELLKEIVPKLSRVAVLGSSTQPGNAQSLKEMELAAGTLGVQLQFLDVLRSQGY